MLHIIPLQQGLEAGMVTEEKGHGSRFLSESWASSNPLRVGGREGGEKRNEPIVDLEVWVEIRPKLFQIAYGSSLSPSGDYSHVTPFKRVVS